MRDDPTNPMANHLCIHLYDLAPDRTPALPCAQRLDAARLHARSRASRAHAGALLDRDAATTRRRLLRAIAPTRFSCSSTIPPAALHHVRQYSKHDVAVGYSAAMMLGNYADRAALGAAHGGSVRFEFRCVDRAAVRPLRRGVFRSAAAVGDPACADWPRSTSDTQARRARSLRTSIRSRGHARLPSAALLGARGRGRRQARRSARAGSRRRADQHEPFDGELIPFLPAGEALGFLELRNGDAAAAAAAFSQTLAAYPNDPRALVSRRVGGGNAARCASRKYDVGGRRHDVGRRRSPLSVMPFRRCAGCAPAQPAHRSSLRPPCRAHANAPTSSPSSHRESRRQWAFSKASSRRMRLSSV